MSFFWEGRFGEKPSEFLKHYYADTLRAPLFLNALHWWDKAQVVVLAEQGLAPREVTDDLVKALVAMEKEGVVEARTQLWNVVHGGEEYIRKFCEEEKSGWIHLGRSSPSLRAVAARIAFREMLLGIMASSIDLRHSLIDLAEKHTETLMPGQAFLQHIEPTTLGFYLMSWVEPLERDFRRFQNVYANTNISSTGTGGAFGIEFAIDLKRLDELLGFDAAPRNARDSIRNYDYLIESYMALALMHNTLGRLAMDFLIWHSPEFSFIKLPDRLSITSSISPQMRIPYVLGFIHGTSGLITGRLVEALGINKSASDQLEMATLLPSEFPKCAEESRYAVSALCDALGGMTVNARRMAQSANDHWCQASGLIGYLVKEQGMSYRTAHQILALLMKRVAEKDMKPTEVSVDMVEQAAMDYLGHKLGLTKELLDRVFDPMFGVREKNNRAGTAPERVIDDIAVARKNLGRDRAQLTMTADRVQAAKDRLDAAFEALSGRR